ncbi:MULTISPECIES: TetR family transcriptional regulator [unclassified Bradyrhizobium]|uniref:TetR family transcriptional regulator n=1 Tax=unclassified Bradyrhizobium TaxID=2631580 RepID=UPI0024795B5D|nr:MULTISPECIES: TetR family transcriptional regulator [unclassified Bradyrhizobium]WGS21739.1 TetR family transcriptional regulator [Bradyrhizobium sp. ISRA463]WGS28688.1 TetR family transcriptional regulator [Bradyrhizobium sp. ISRA464]
MNRPVRTANDSDEARARILEVAEEHFRRIGYHKTSVADIASELGMSPANVYRFFPSRDAINESICGRLVNEVADLAFAIARTNAPAFVRALGLSKVRIVAHSSGAHAALFFAARNPDMVVSLALNEPPATGLVAGNPSDADMLKSWGAGQVPAREAVKAGKAQEAPRVTSNSSGCGQSNSSTREAGQKGLLF